MALAINRGNAARLLAALAGQAVTLTALPGVSPQLDWRGEFRRRFARLATVALVRHPWLWGAFRGPLRRQFDQIAPTWEWRFGREALAPLEAALARVERSDARSISAPVPAKRPGSSPSGSRLRP